MDQARATAVRVLLRVEAQGYADLSLKSALQHAALPPQQRAFVSALVYGTLEKQRLLDALLALHLRRGLPQLDAPVRAILRSGLYQCRYMDGVPLYAAVSASVELARAFGVASAAGMVNAVLRRAAASDVKQLAFTSETQRLGTLHNVCDGVVDMLRQAYPAQVQAILQAFDTPAPLILRVNTLRCDASQLCALLAQEGLRAQPVEGWPAAVRLPQGGDIAATEAFRQGLCHVQGLASQLAAQTLDVQPGQTVLDMCAAPGGKSLMLAQRMQNSGRLICGEVHAARLQLLREQLQRCGITCAQACLADAAHPPQEWPAAQAILCDVPCSGTGTLAKKPDIRYRDPAAARKERTALQADILRAAAARLAPGGQLVYATCSLDPAENDAVVQTVLRERGDLAVLPVAPVGLGCLHTGSGLTILPAAGHNDGFFIAKLQKVCYTNP